MFLMLLLPVAGAFEGSVALGVAAVRSSSGQHPVQAAAALAVRHRKGPWSAGAECAFGTRTDAVLGDTWRTTLVRPALLAGVWTGDDPLRLHLAVGPALTVLVGEGGATVGVGARVRSGLDLALGSVGRVGVLVGAASRGRSGDFDLMAGWSRPW